MELVVFAGSGNPPLAAAIASALGIPLGQRCLARAPDGELRVEIQENVRAREPLDVKMYRLPNQSLCG